MSETKSRGSTLQRALSQPFVAADVLIALARGWWYRGVCRLRRIPMQAGRNFRVYGRIRFGGPGRVIFGDNVSVRMEVTPFTYDANAVIAIGDGSFVNGTAFGCQSAIRIGARAILANANIMDTDFHSLDVGRHEEGAPVRVAPVVLEENVWVAARAGILPGTTIGRNSVVGFGAVCAGVYPANSVIVGNPARVVRAVPDELRRPVPQ
ncbi:MAG: acyltransferase [Gemmatimonadaceae bacterium]